MGSVKTLEFDTLPREGGEDSLDTMTDVTLVLYQLNKAFVRACSQSNSIEATEAVCVQEVLITVLSQTPFH
jgi:hypothetical protein